MNFYRRDVQAGTYSDTPLLFFMLLLRSYCNIVLFSVVIGSAFAINK